MNQSIKLRARRQQAEDAKRLRAAPAVRDGTCRIAAQHSRTPVGDSCIVLKKYLGKCPKKRHVGWSSYL